jgi:CheY-like chemotaxis protein
VLCVDDNQINLNLLVAFVKKTKNPFTSAMNGLQALEAYKKSATEDGGKNRFQFVLMDISMPVMDGIAAAQEIRQFEKENQIESPATIIALTGLGSEHAQKDAYQAGFNQFLSKPIVSYPFELDRETHTDQWARRNSKSYRTFSCHDILVYILWMESRRGVQWERQCIGLA